MGSSAERRGYILSSSEKTIEYYNQHAAAFTENTVGADMTTIRDAFLSKVEDGGLILDFGCGSGRDSKAFLEKGYQVEMLDGSEELCKAAEELTGHPVILNTFQDYVPSNQFDGIWACSSLLHLGKDELPGVIEKLTSALKPSGYFYLSFKNGTFSGERRGRYFTDLTEGEMRELISNIHDLKIDEMFLTGDVRPGRSNEKWLNVFAVKEKTK
jgi:2-polyprenyl-3-methyl-5-hydroxy-6-metoxy-1,4-benzoquinol methylase